MVPPVELHVEERCYRVDGCDAAELRLAIALAGPREGDRSCVAYTRWVVRWCYEARPRSGGYSVSSAHVRCDSTIILPSWDPPSEARPELVALWTGVMRELRAHEEGHVAIAYAAADGVRAALTTVTAERSAAVLRASVQRSVRRVVDAHRFREQRYDVEASVCAAGSALDRLWPRAGGVWARERARALG